MPEAQPRRHQTALHWPLLLTALLLALLPVAGHGQSDEEKALKQLQQLERDIKRISRDIASASTRRDKLQRQLREAEVELGSIARDITDNRQAVVEGKRELAQLQDQRAALEKSRDTQQARIAAELKTAWQMGRQGQLKVLLNQEHPDTVARSMGYYRYFFEARNKLLEQYRKTLRELETLQQKIDATLAQLDGHKQALERQQDQLLKAQDNRRDAVAQLAASINNQSEQLKGLQQDRKELESLLQAIEQAVDKLVVPENYQAFQSARGKMPWPVQGKASNRFGRPRNNGKMRWQGITIPAKEGTTVNAIHHGRVVYADWLRGSGLLLIVDHGDGYMSLYAHNQSLLRDVGEWVTAGTPISTVGSSGGQDRPALYFEVRQNGKPIDPARWCKR